MEGLTCIVCFVVVAGFSLAIQGAFRNAHGPFSR